MTLKAVIFDVDGTLIDSNDQHALAWLKTFRRFGREARFEDIRAQIGKGGDQLMPVFLSPQDIEAEGEAMSQFRVELFKREFLPGLQPFPGVRELFQRIRADGREIVLASSASGQELARYKEIADVADLLDGATSSDDAEHSKPEPDIFLAALQRVGVQPDEALVIGDTPYDAQAADKAGVRSIGLLCGGFPEAVLREAGCLSVYRDPSQLLEIYDQSPLAARAEQA
ncbi:MAG: HAD family hydrolase [Proteobacteria bacterium]|nr:HAD family hydrolase [Pseudomonadota bacterium]MBW3618241.1 HAD family hydrolase [Pseudomonadota bacterium]